MFQHDRIPHKTQFYQRTEVLMLPKRQDAVIYSTLHIHAPQLRDLLNEKGLRFFPYVLYACVKTATLHPVMRRFVMGSRFYTHKHLSLSTVIKADKTNEDSNAFVKLTFDAQCTPQSVKAILDKAIESTRKGTSQGANGLMNALSHIPSIFFTVAVWIAQKLDNLDLLPNALIDEDPLHTSLIIANLGSIGGEAVHHHLFNWGTCSIVMTLGTLSEEGHVDIGIAVDERIAEGIGFFKAMDTFKAILEHPDEHLR
jgi:chloramphenicol O-acetyltransferase